VAKRTALQQYLQTFFGGSLRQMMTALVSEASWTDEELRRLRNELDRVRKKEASLFPKRDSQVIYLGTDRIFLFTFPHPSV